MKLSHTPEMIVEIDDLYKHWARRICRLLVAHSPRSVRFAHEHKNPYTGWVSERIWSIENPL